MSAGSLSPSSALLLGLALRVIEALVVRLSCTLGPSRDISVVIARLSEIQSWPLVIGKRFGVVVERGRNCDNWELTKFGTLKFGALNVQESLDATSLGTMAAFASG